MISSALPADTAEEGVREAALALAGQDVLEITPAGAGGNNRVYRVETARGPVALKNYPATAGDDRDRLGTEFRSLRFLNGNGVGCVPAALASGAGKGFALYEWIDGAPVTAPGDTEIDAVLGFVEVLAHLGGAEGADGLPPASEACLSAAELSRQLHARMAALATAAPDHPELADFLGRDLRPAMEGFEAAARRAYRNAGLDFDGGIERTVWTLNPSDFGFHNALRRPDGGIVFLDFEYFGWDDPVKMVADFLLHPGHRLGAGSADRFYQGALGLFGGGDFARRLSALYPLYGLRWCLIVLAEFLPDRMARRQRAGRHADAGAARRRQLEKSRARFAALIRTDGALPHGD